MKRVLIVETHRIWIDILREKTQSALRNVSDATELPVVKSSIEEAWEALNNEGPWDLVITDISMQRRREKPGIKIVERSNSLGVPCIVVSSESDSADVRDFFKNYNIIDFIPKTRFDDDDFKELVIGVLTDEKEKLTEEFCWIHLSDFHCSSEKDRDAAVVLEPLLLDIKKMILENRLSPDLVIFSGDIAFSGKENEYEIAAYYVDKILEITKLPKSRLLFVPGNHDVNRGRVDAFSDVAMRQLKDRDSFNNFLSNKKATTLVLEKLEEFNTFAKRYEERAIEDRSSFHGLKKIEVGETQIIVVGLNSVWVSSRDDEFGNLVIGEKQIRDSLDVAIKRDICIAVAHHPLTWLQHFDAQDIDALLSRHFDFFLHGHMHEQMALNVAKPDSKIVVLGAGACYDNREYPNSYNIVKLNVIKRTGVILFRTYSDKSGGFWTKDSLSYRDIDGEYEFSF